MKKAILYTFSGTGNTLIAANMLATSLGNHGYSADVHSVCKSGEPVPDPNAYDLVGFGYPIHAFNAPEIFVNFVRALPAVSEGKPTFYFKTSGEPFSFNDASSALIHKALTGKGYQPMLERHLLMPYNIMFRYDNSLAKQMYLYTRAMCEAIAVRIERGERAELHYTLGRRILAGAFRIQWFGAHINGPLYHVKMNKCVQCGQCVRECPTENIKLADGHFKFGTDCTMCMRCAMSCPQDAIRPGFLNPWRVNGKYNFRSLAADASVADEFVNDETSGYFGLFRKYYRRADAELLRLDIPIPRESAQSYTAESQEEFIPGML